MAKYLSGHERIPRDTAMQCLYIARVTVFFGEDDGNRVLSDFVRIAQLSPPVPILTTHRSAKIKAMLWLFFLIEDCSVPF